MTQTVTVTVDDKELAGSFTVERGMVTAYFGDLWKTTQVGASAEMTARMLIREMGKDQASRKGGSE